MKKHWILSTIAISVSGFIFWQFGNQYGRGAGETRSADTLVTVKGNSVDTFPALQRAQFPPGAPAGRKTGTTVKAEAQPAANVNGDEGKEPGDPQALLSGFFASAKPGQIMQHFAERRRARAELVKTRMSAEYVDQGWSAELSQRFESARTLLPALAPLSLSQADCRETICALHISFAGSGYAKFAPYMENVGSVLGADAWVHHDALPDGAVIYVAKADSRLPDLQGDGLPQ